jgi:hypothetical protein
MTGTSAFDDHAWTEPSPTARLAAMGIHRCGSGWGGLGLDGGSREAGRDHLLPLVDHWLIVGPLVHRRRDAINHATV